MKRLLGTALYVLMAVGMMTACSDGLDNESSMKVNGVSYGIDDAGIAYTSRIVDSQGEFEIPAHAGCDIYFNTGDDMYVFDFSIYGIKHESDLTKGKDVTEDIVVHDYRSIYSIEFDYRYDVTAGSVIVKDIAHGYAIMEFNNFTFVKESGRYKDKYTMNGIVKFYDINVE